MSKIEKLLANVEAAKKAAHAEMLRRYPVGSEIRFTVMNGQRNASTGTVACVSHIPGSVRVKHHQAKEFAEEGRTRRWHSLMQRAEHLRSWWHAEAP